MGHFGKALLILILGCGRIGFNGRDGDAAVGDVGDAEVLVAPTEPPTFSWSRGHGGPDVDYGNGIVLMPDGRVVLSIDVNGAVDFGGGLLASRRGTPDTFLVSYSADGEQLAWVTQISPFVNTGGISEANGAIYSTGAVTNEADFGQGTTTVEADLSGALYTARYNEDGGLLDAWTVGGLGSSQRGFRIQPAPDDSVYLTGTSQAPVDFGGGNMVPVAGASMFVTRLDASTGVFRWAQSFLGAVGVPLVVTGNDGGAVVAARFMETVDFGAGPMVVPAWGVFVAHYQALGGTLLWSSVVEATEEPAMSGVVALPDGSVVAAGAFTGQLSVDGEVVSSAGNTDSFIIRWGPDGAIQRYVVVSSTDTVRLGQLTVDPFGRLLVAGSFRGTVTLAAGDVTSGGEEDLIVLALETGSLSPVWAIGAGGPGSQTGGSIAADAAQFCVQGHYNDGADLGGGGLPNAQFGDGFVGCWGWQ